MNKRQLFRSLSVVAAGLGGFSHLAGAVDYSWGGTSGNWTVNSNWSPNTGNPSATTDTATIDAAGIYTVTVNAARTINSFTLNSAGATLNASSTLRSIASPTLTSGSLQGTLVFGIDASPMNVDFSNVSFAGPTTLQITRYTAGEKYGSFASSGIPANLTVDLFSADASLTGTYPRGNMFITTTNGYANHGTLRIRATGDDYGGVGNETNVFYTVASGTLTNHGLLEMATKSGAANSATFVSANIANQAGASVTSSGGTSQANGLTLVGATHVNQGSWTVTGSQGLVVAGPGTSFTQSGATASLTASYMQFNNTFSPAAANTFTVNDGSLQGFFDFRATDVTIAAAATYAGPTTLKFYSAGNPGQNFFSTLDVPSLPAAATLDIRCTANLRGRVQLTSPSGFVSYANVTILSSTQDYGNALLEGDAYWTVSNGTLVNRGTIVISQTLVDSYAQNAQAVLEAEVRNDPAGTITMNSSTMTVGSSGQAILGKAGANHANAGLIAIAGGAKNRIDGATLTNETGGVIRGTGTAILQGTATIDNAAGTIEATAGTFTIQNSIAQIAGGVLAGGTWKASGAGTHLILPGGAITAVGPLAQVVITDGASIDNLANLATLNGHLHVTGGGGYVNSNPAGLVVGGTGLVTGDAAIMASALINGGTVSPGLSPGLLTIDGDYLQTAAGLLYVELGGTVPETEHDLLVVTGAATLAGVLAVEFVNGYFPDPKKGVTYDVLTAASITIDSGFALGGTWGGMFLWEVLDDQTGSVLRLTSNIPEPASALLLALLAVSLPSRAGAARRRRNQ